MTALGDSTSAIENGFLEALLGDVAAAYKEAQVNPSQFARRNLVRCVFAAVEGVSFELRQRCLAIKPSPFSEAEVFLLREQSFALNGKGQPYSRPAYFPLEDSLKFTFNMYCRTLPASPQIEYNGPGWDAFRESVAIRHRLTHPKSVAALDLSNDELNTVGNAYIWYMRTLMLNVLDAIDAFRAQIGDLRANTGGPGASPDAP